jgi:putative transposase
VSLHGKRLELPSRYRQLKEVYLRYARWDLSRVDLIQSRSGTILCAVHPLDKAANAQAIRRVLDPMPNSTPIPQAGIAPLLKQMMADYAATGLPPAYLPTPPEDPS